MRSLLAAAALALIATAPVAQEDPMELQRCVWRCLAANGPATNPAYHACVEQLCTGMSEPAATAPAPRADPTSAWQVGRAGDGTGYAGIDGVRGRTGIYYFCKRGGRSFLRLVGAGDGGVSVTVDGRRFDLSTRPNGRNQAEAELPYTAPVIRALQSGNRVQVRTGDGRTVVDAPLTGSRRALAEVISGC